MQKKNCFLEKIYIRASDFFILDILLISITQKKLYFQKGNKISDHMREISNTTVCCDYLVAMARPDQSMVAKVSDFQV